MESHFFTDTFNYRVSSRVDSGVNSAASLILLLRRRRRSAFFLSACTYTM